MSFLLQSLRSLAVIVLLMAQPSGQWYCTAENAPCLFGPSPLAAVEAPTCCAETPAPTEPETCCFEKSGDLYVTPSGDDLVPSAPTEMANGSATFFERTFALRDRQTPSGIVPEVNPPPGVGFCAVFCVRLI